jgi:peptidyl-dipeptidase A
MPEPRQFVNEVSARYAALEYVANETWWTANVSSSDAADDAHAAANVALRTFFSDAETFAEIRDALAETRAVGESGRAVDANLVRELEILLQRFLPNQISEESRLRQVELETRIGSTYNRFRSTLDGVRVSDNEIVGLLRESTDATKRRKAWEASKQIGEAVANDVRALVRLRNEAARGLGFRDYFEMGLSTSDLDEDRLFATLAELETMTDGVWRERKGELDAQLAARFGVPVDDLRPWHYEDPFFQELPLAGSSVLETHFGQLDPTAVTLETFDALGLDARSVVDRSDLYARDAKSQHAFCVHLDRSGDVRVLCNVEPNRHWMGTMLHEFGHAVYDEAVDPTLPWLVRVPA